MANYSAGKIHEPQYISAEDITSEPRKFVGNAKNSDRNAGSMVSQKMVIGF